ncbi:hypothetical protein HOY80DRAFT_52612 [Tuber brumale]|nr:hypothetical protein HOY80DRAFT_52612 [Tuber brumale]
MVSLREIWGITGGEGNTGHLVFATFSFSFFFFSFFSLVLSFLPFLFLFPFDLRYPSPYIFLFYLFQLFFFFSLILFFFFIGWDVRHKIRASHSIWGLLYSRRGSRPEGQSHFLQTYLIIIMYQYHITTK